MSALGKSACRLARRIAGRKRVLILLDFDGTLCEFSSSPQDARLTARRRAILRSLRQGLWAVAISTGRSLADIKKRIGLPNACYSGNFGLEISGPRWRFRHPLARACRLQLDALREKLSALFCALTGVLVESKTLGLTLHERDVPAGKLGELRRRLAQLRRESRPHGLRWERGARAWEVIPDVGWGKREAALLLWRRLNRPYMLVIGDGKADEGSFQAARGRGSAMLVGRRRRSAAAYRLKNVEEVYRFLETLTASRRP